MTLDLRDRAAARRNDPDTSHTAAQGASIDLRERQRAVLMIFKDAGSLVLLDEELIEYYLAIREDEGWPDQQASGIRTRRKELFDAGLLRQGPKKRMSTGNKGYTYTLSDEGRKAVI